MLNVTNTVYSIPDPDTIAFADSDPDPITTPPFYPKRLHFISKKTGGKAMLC
jgi:hypothetical protein